MEIQHISRKTELPAYARKRRMVTILKISAVGCGGISGTHIINILKHKDAQLVSAADIVFERAEKVFNETGAKAYKSLDELLEGEKPDVLHICTPHYLHVPMALKAMSMGIHVLIEKPCAVTLEQLKALREAQRETGLHVGVCFQNRYNASTIRLEEILKDTEANGRLIGARGFVTWHRTKEYYADDWHGKRDKECGGVLINQAIHTLDLIGRFAGGFTAVTGTTSNDHLKGVIEVEDTVSALLEFTGGAQGVFYATTASAADYPVFSEFKCENATYRLEGDNLFQIHRDGRIETLKPYEEKEYTGKMCWGTGHEALINDFYASVIDDRPFFIDAFEGGKAIEAVLGIYRSAQTGERVPLVNPEETVQEANL